MIFPKDPGSPNLRNGMEPTYFAFREVRLYSPYSSFEKVSQDPYRHYTSSKHGKQ